LRVRIVWGAARLASPPIAAKLLASGRSLGDSFSASTQRSEGQ
jgi:hypothetical protein